MLNNVTLEASVGKFTVISTSGIVTGVQEALSSNCESQENCTFVRISDETLFSGIFKIEIPSSFQTENWKLEIRIRSPTKLRCAYNLVYLFLSVFCLIFIHNLLGLFLQSIGSFNLWTIPIIQRHFTILLYPKTGK